MTEVLIAFGSSLGGILLSWLFDVVRDRYRFRKELRELGYIDVSGDDWVAAWQTSVENVPVLNTERILMKQRGNTVRVRNLERSPENPKGGYLWESQLLFSQGRSLMGWYFPVRGENTSSRGVMFLYYEATRKRFYGRWVGAAYDGELASGFVVITKDRDQSMSELRNLLAVHPDQVNVITTGM